MVGEEEEDMLSSIKKRLIIIIKTDTFNLLLKNLLKICILGLCAEKKNHRLVFYSIA